MKYAKQSGVVSWSGGMMTLRQGMSIDDDHPLVTESPDLWTDQAPGADIPHPGREARRVQSTMQRPGESRMERTPPPETQTPPVTKAPPRNSKS